MSREENVAIFENTRILCKTNKSLIEAVMDSTQKQELILEDDLFPVSTEKRYKDKAQIIVSTKRSFEAAAGYKGQMTCVHNFASSITPGGGVLKGSSAQEECLCRISSLYFCLDTKTMWDGFYKPHRNELDNVHNDDLIFTPNVVVFKTDTTSPKLMEEEDWYKVDVITLAAPMLRYEIGLGHNGSARQTRRVTDEELLAIHEKRMRRFLAVAKEKGEEVLILGAFGCGAFMNSPQVVAQAMKNILPDYLYDFKTIEFAVYCLPNDETNYKVFESMLSGLA